MHLCRNAGIDTDKVTCPHFLYQPE
jgi:hypothetical protein